MEKKHQRLLEDVSSIHSLSALLLHAPTLIIACHSLSLPRAQPLPVRILSVVRLVYVSLPLSRACLCIK